MGQVVRFRLSVLEVHALLRIQGGLVVRTDLMVQPDLSHHVDQFHQVVLGGLVLLEFLMGHVVHLDQ